MTSPGARPESDDLGVPPRFWDLVERRAATTPDSVMLRDEHGRIVTFDEYRSLAERVAAGLAAMGVEPGSRVSWQLPTTVEAAVLLAAIARLDAVQNPIVPLLRAAEVEFIVDQTDADLLVVPDSWRGFDHARMGRSIVAGRSCELLVCDLGGAATDLALPLGDSRTLDPMGASDPDDAGVRWIFYSSGTTGTPKGVMHRDRAMMAAPGVMIQRGRLGPDDVFSMPYAITHVGGPTAIAAQLRVPFEMLLVGSFDAATTPDLFAKNGLTIVGSARPFFQTFLEAQRQRGNGRLLPRARVAMSGGSAVPPELHHAVKDELADGGVLSVWGLTEFPMATCTDLDDTDEQKGHTVGRAADGVEIRIVDLEGNEVGPGVEGELLVRGPQILLGYVDPALDAEAFDADGFFRSGDLGSIDEHGYVRVTGRIKDVIIRNAENISAAEVEAVVATHPAVADVTVIGMPDERTGERVCAVVVVAAGHAAPTLPDLVEHCKARGIAAYKIPEQLEVVDDLPRNPLGKIVKADVRRRVDRAAVGGA